MTVSAFREMCDRLFVANFENPEEGANQLEADCSRFLGVVQRPRGRAAFEAWLESVPPSKVEHWIRNKPPAVSTAEYLIVGIQEIYHGGQPPNPPAWWLEEQEAMQPTIDALAKRLQAALESG